MEKSQNIKTRPKLLVLFCIIFSIAFVVNAFATSQNVSFSFSTGSTGNAYADGSYNGKFYSLNKGTATLTLTDADTCYTGGSYSATLYRYSWVGYGHNCGTLVANPTAPGSTHTKTMTIPSNNDKYYLFVTGSGYFKTYAASGSLTQ